MLFQKLAILAGLTALIAAQDIEQSDIPQQCTAICAEVVSLARRCDDQNNTDAEELQCICSATNANTLIPTCEACVAQFDTDTDDDDNINDNDVRDVLTRCSFTTTSFNTASASSVLQSIASSLASVASVGSVSVSSSVVVATTTSGSVVLTTAVSTVASTTTVTPQQTVNAAPAKNVGKAIGLGALGVVVGML